MCQFVCNTFIDCCKCFDMLVWFRCVCMQANINTLIVGAGHKKNDTRKNTCRPMQSGIQCRCTWFVFQVTVCEEVHCSPIRVIDCSFIAPAGLDIGLVGPVARGASIFENLLAPPKTYWPPKKLTSKPNLRDEKLFA